MKQYTRKQLKEYARLGRKYGPLREFRENGIL